MELAVAQGFDVRVVPLPPDRIQRTHRRASRRGSAMPRAICCTASVELDRSSDRQEAFVRAREVLARAEDSPERHDALRLVADRLGAATRDPGRHRAGSRGDRDRAEPTRLLGAGERLERDALAACVANPSLRTFLAELAGDHFDSELQRRFREALLDGVAETEDLIALRAELDAYAQREGLDERAGRSCSCGYGSAGCAGTSTRQRATSSASQSSRRSWRACGRRWRVDLECRVRRAGGEIPCS